MMHVGQDLIRKGDICMFKDYEPLVCDLCEKEFLGRKPVSGGDVLCPECLEADETEVLLPEDELSDEVLAEIEDGRGED